MATTFQNPALSLWQSIVHRGISARDPSAQPGLRASADHPAMTAAIAASHAVDADEGAPEVDASGSPFASGASLYARLAVAKFKGDHAGATKIQDELRYSVCDPLWAELMLEYETSLVSEKVDSYTCHASLDDFILPPMPDDVTIALVADWATGTASARAILEQIASLRPDVVIHLGDVYFSGLPEEVHAHFLDVFAAVFADRMPRVLTLAGNHDRYSGGRGLVELLAALEQPASYFALQNRWWQLLGMDTGLHDREPTKRRVNVTELEPGEVAWHLDKIERARGARGTILLSHHQLFSSGGVGLGAAGRLAVNPNLHANFAPVLGELAWWFWGHEHNLSIFAPYAGLARGRGIGSGAIPIFVEQKPYTPAEGLILPEGEAGPPTPLPGTELQHNGVVYDHAFAILRLAGPTATTSYYASDTTGGTAKVGAPLYTETVTLAR